VPPHDLPVELTSFIGREDEVADLTRGLASTRLLTLTGPGGAGKTRLAVEAARRFDGGRVWFVELSAIVDSALIPGAIATAAGIAEVAGETPLETLASTLSAAHGLLVLDNCEHLVGPCAVVVAHLLQACPSLRVLATSREPLNLAGEQVHRLLPLGVSEAAALFLDRAVAAEPSFTARPEEPALVDSICHRLDGLPLAIELAAPYVRLLSLKELAARLDQRFELLQSRTPTAAARHQTLRALVAWSYELLSAEEQRLYRRLSVFAGGCSFDAIEGVCRDEAGGGRFCLSFAGWWRSRWFSPRSRRAKRAIGCWRRCASTVATSCAKPAKSGNCGGDTSTGFENWPNRESGRGTAQARITGSDACSVKSRTVASRSPGAVSNPTCRKLACGWRPRSNTSGTWAGTQPKPSIG